MGHFCPLFVEIQGFGMNTVLTLLDVIVYRGVWGVAFGLVWFIVFNAISTIFQLYRDGQFY